MEAGLRLSCFPFLAGSIHVEVRPEAQGSVARLPVAHWGFVRVLLCQAFSLVQIRALLATPPEK